MKNYQVQIKNYFKNYDNKGRFNSYWHQIEEILKSEGKTILEIGIGNSFIRDYLKKRNLNIITIDIDLNLKPDIVGSVLFLPIVNNSFETVVCYQVLEHLPFENIPIAISELSRVAKKYVIISLPNRMKLFRLDIAIYPLFQKSINLTIPYLIPPKHKYDGEHYWEIGKRGTLIKNIKALFSKHYLELVKEFRVPEKPLHHFFILKKIE